MNPTICDGTNANGERCSRRAQHHTAGFSFCFQHNRSYTRDNPSERLGTTDTLNSACAVHILDKMRGNPDLVNRAVLELLVTRQMFDPAENVNKFITGGVAEDILAELISSLGFPTVNIAAISNVVDIRVTVGDHTIDFSLKNSGGIDQQPILENFRGDTRTEIRPLPPTLIIYTEMKCKRARIVYIDHDILRTAFPDLSDEEFHARVYNRSDSNLTFKSGVLKNLIPRIPEAYIVNATYPDVIPMVEKKSITLLALEHVRKSMA